MQSQFTLLKLLQDRLTTTSSGSAATDLQGYVNPGGRQMKAFLMVANAAGTTPSVTTKLQESDTTTAADFTDITGGAFTAVTTNGNQTIHFRTAKRYIRAVNTFTANTTQADIALVVLVGNRQT